MVGKLLITYSSDIAQRKERIWNFHFLKRLQINEKVDTMANASTADARSQMLK